MIAATWSSFSNLVSSVTLFAAGTAIYMAIYTMVCSWKAESGVTAGHPRRRLYRHITVIAAFHVWLMVGFAITISLNWNTPLRWYTPFGLVGYLGTIYGLWLMISYQNTRLSYFHSAKMVVGTVEPSEEPEQDVAIHVVASPEPMAMRDFVADFVGAPLCRVYIEKVEEPREAIAHGRKA
jgi:hypothetical protein